jgi:hypothetical protein
LSWLQEQQQLLAAVAAAAWEETSVDGDGVGDGGGVQEVTLRGGIQLDALDVCTLHD